MKVTLTIPETLADISLKNYQKYYDIQQKNPDAHEFLGMKTIEIFCGLDLKQVNQIKMKDFNDIVKSIKTAFEKDKKWSVDKNMFKLNGITFGFINDLENITMGEYIDITNYISDQATWHRAMAVMYRPVTNKHKKTYLIEDYESSEKYSSDMLEAPMNIVFAATDFFYSLAKKLLQYIPEFLRRQAEGDILLKKFLQKNGDGIKASMPWPGEIL